MHIIVIYPLKYWDFEILLQGPCVQAETIFILSMVLTLKPMAQRLQLPIEGLPRLLSFAGSSPESSTSTGRLF